MQPDQIAGTEPPEALSGSIAEAAATFRRRGYLVLRDVFPAAMINAMRDSFAQSYAKYCHEAEFEDALTVGPKRYKITIALESPFDTPLLYANSAILPILQELLEPQLALASFVCVNALAGAPEQTLHRDHPWLFGTPLDRMLPSYAIKLAIPLAPLNASSGTTRVWPGSQTEFDITALKGDGEEPFLQPGDCMLTDYRIVHQGMANNSEAVRPVLFLSYSRRWFRDQENFAKQKRIQAGEAFLHGVALEHQHLFSRIEAGTA